MKKNNTFKRFLAFLLCATMMVTYMPTSVLTLADETEGAAVEQEAPAQEAPKAEEPAPAPEPEAPKAEEPAPAPEPEAPKAEEPKAEEPKAPKAEEPKAEEPKADKPADEAAPAEKATEVKEDEEKPEYPAVKLEGKAGDVDVEVEAPEGALPEGVKLDVDKVTADEAKEVVADLIPEDKDIDEMMSVDLSFTKDGKKVEPKKAVTVKLSSDKIQGKDLTVFNKDSDSKVKKLEGDMTANSGKFEGRDFARLVMVTLKDKEDTDTADDGEDGEDAEEADPDSETPEAEPEEPVEEEPVAEPEGEAVEEEPIVEPEIAYPAKDFTGSASGVDVSVHAPEGALPEGTTMKVKGVGVLKMSSVKKAVSKELGEDAEVVKAVDITFYGPDGKEVQPNKSVSVSFSSSTFSDINEPAVVHIDDSKKADQIRDGFSADGDAVAFNADSFSVYVVVETGTEARAKVNFHQYNGDITTIWVKQFDTEEPDRYAQVLYDPGAGELGQNVAFYGWTTDQNYTTESTKITIEDIRTQVANRLAQEGFVDGTEIDYYAAVFKAFIVTYKDTHGVVLGSDTNLEQPDVTSSDYTIQLSYAIEDPDQDFKGWFINPATNATLADGTAIDPNAYYPNDTAIKLLGNVTLTVDAPKGAWLIFRENGSGATYTKPQFLEANDMTVQPDNPSRNGYSFGGWYENPECTGNAFTFGSSLPATKTLYAKWNENTTAKYTVLLWKQNVAGDGYDFYRAWTFNDAQVGRTIQSLGKVSRSGNGNNAYATIDGVQYRAGSNDATIKKDFTGFHFDHFDPALNTTVSSQGDTVINVYYNRNSYTLTFQTWRWSIWGSGWNTIATITALYEQDISSYFAQGQQLNGYYWEPQSSSTFSYGLAAIATMPAENITFHGYDNSVSHNMYFYVEALDYSAPGLKEYQGKKFELLTTASASGYRFLTYEEDFIKRIGYERFYFHGYNNSGFNQEMSAAEFETARTTREYQGTAEFYYTRKTYTINFMDGIYLSGNSNEQVYDKHTQQLNESDPIAYGASLAEYDDYKPNGGAGWTFSGWYLDAACTEPCDFTSTNMPEGGLTVYAKWHNTQYRVFLHPNVPTSTPEDYMGGQSTSFRLDYGDNLGFIDAHRDDYELVGWYTDEDFKHQFKFEAYTFNDENITGEYDKSRSTELDLYGNVTGSTNSDTDRPWVNNCVDLYARWRSKIVGADGINVVYEPGDGTGEPTDDQLYKDLAMAHVGSATIPNDENKVFAYWEVMKYENGKFVGTKEKAYPGSTFEVKKDYAQVIELEGSTTEDPKYQYIVKLKAVYVDKDQDTTTHIWWYPNGANGSVVKQNTLYDDTTAEEFPINKAVVIKPYNTFTRDGYRFVGWYRDHTTSETVSATEPNFLWYNKEDGKFYSDANYTKEAAYVAADEVTPYDNLYAIWTERLQIKITGENDTVPYTGEEQSVSGYTIEYKVGNGEWTTEAPAGVTVSGLAQNAAVAKGTDVNTDPGYPMGLKAGDFTIDAGDYDFFASEDLTITDGWLKIEPIHLKVKVEGNTDNLTYNGSKQSVTGYSVKYSVDGGDTWSETAPTGVEVSGPAQENAVASGTDVNTDPGYPMGLTADNFTITNTNSNYEFDKENDLTVIDGKLTIEKAAITITINGSHDEKVYNGSAQTSETTVTPSCSNALFDASKFSYTGETTITETNVGEYSEAIDITKAAYNDSNLDVTFTAGTPVTFEITKKAITITINGSHDEKVYNGSAQTSGTMVTPSCSDSLFDASKFSYTGATTITKTNVGEYSEAIDITKAAYNDSNLDVAFAAGTPVTFDITRATMTVKAEDYNGTYDGATHNGGATPSVTEGTTIQYRVKNGDTWGEWGDTVPSITDVGTVTYEVKATNPNYNDATDEGTLTVTKAPVTITLTGKTKTVTYNGEEQAFGDYVVGINDPSHTATHSIYKLKDPMPKAKGTDVGTYPIGLDDSCISARPTATNYDITFVVIDGSLTIDKAPLIITAKPQTYTYNGQAQGPEGTYTDGFDTYVTVEGLQGGDALSSITLAGKKTNAGTYENEIVPSAAAVTFNHTTDKTITDNYNVTYNKATLTINTAGLTATAPADVVYNCNEQKLDPATVKDSATGATLTKGTDYELSWSDDCTNVGTVTITVTGKGNYAGSTATVTYKITPAEIKIKADDKTKVYDEDPSTDPALTATVTGVPTGGTAPVYTLSRAAGQNVGDYEITVTADAEATPNYTITVESGTFSITPREVTITAGSDSKVYDGNALTCNSFTATDLEEGDSHAFTVTMTEGSTITNFGTKANVIATVDGVELTDEIKDKTTGAYKVGNYLVKTVDGELEITKAKITLTGEHTVTYNGAEQKLELDASKATGLAEGETLVFTRKPTVTGTDAGTYGGTWTKENPDFNFNFGTWGVDKADGIGDSTGNYDLEVTGTLTIEKAPLTITAKPQTYTYDGTAKGEDNQTYTTNLDQKVTVTGLQGGDTLSSITLNGQETDAGEYADKIVPSAAAVTFNHQTQKTIADNYDVTYAPGKLTISKLAVTVDITGNTDSKVYNGGTQSVTGYTVKATVTDPETGDQVETDLYKVSGNNKDFTFSGEAVASGIDPGIYTMGLAASQFTNTNNNFDVTFNVKGDGVLMITKAPLTITMKPQTYTYNGQPQGPAGTYGSNAYGPYMTVEGLKGGDTLFSVAITGKKTNAGTYAKEISVDVDQCMVNYNHLTDKKFSEIYNITIIQADLTIKPATMDLTVGDYEDVYDGQAHTVTATPSVIEGTTLYYSEDGETWDTTAPTWTDFTNGAKTVYVKAENPNYETETGEGTVTITKKTITLTGSKTETYNGQEQKLELSADDATGVVSGETLGFQRTPTVKGTNVGTYEDVDCGAWYVTKANGDESTFNYELDLTGTLTIKSKVVTITAGSDSKVYDGNALTCNSFTATDLEEDDSHTFTVTMTEESTITNFGTKANVIATVDSVELTDDIKDETTGAYKVGNYLVKTVDGELEITKLAVIVEIAGNYDVVTYTGEEQSISGYTATAKVTDPETGEHVVTDLYKVSGDNKDFTFSGTDVAKGTDVGIYTMTFDDNSFTNTNNNFDVRFYSSLGGLVIGPAELTIKAKPQTYTYNGQPQGPAGTYTTGFDTYVTVEGLVGGDKLSSITLAGKETDANVYEGKIVPSAVAVKFNHETDKTAAYNYTITYEPATLTINKLPVTVAVTGEQVEKVYDGNTYTASWSMKANNDLYDVDTMVEHNYADSVSRTDVGTSPLDLVNTGFKNNNDNFDVTFNVVKDAKVTITEATLTATAPNDVVFNGHEQKLSPATVTNSVTGAALTEGTDYELSWSEDCTNVGEVTITVTGKGNYAGSTATVTYNITKAPVTLHVRGLTDTKTYNGEEQEVTGKSFSFDNPTGASFSHGDVYNWVGNAEAKGTDVGTYPMGITKDDVQLTEFAKRNLDLTLDVVDGWLKIEKAPLTITALPKTYTYNGQPQGPAGTYTTGFNTYVTVDGLVGGDALSSITLAGKKTNAGTYENEIVPSAAAVTFNHETQKTITDNYNVTYEKANLVIEQLAVTVTITGEQVETTYDGNPHTAGWTMAANNELYNTSTMVTTTAAASVSRTDYGKSSLNLGKDQFTNKNDNFDVTFVVAKDAYVDIAKAVVRVIITGNKDEVTYDGNEHTVTGFTATATMTDPETGEHVATDLYKVDGANKDFTFSGTDTITKTNADTYYMGLRDDQFANTNDNFDVTFVVSEDGKLIINKANITITADNKDKVYDNDPTTDPELTATVTGKPKNGVDPVYDLTRDEGQDVGKYTIYVGAGADDNPNYNITGKTGIFEIKKKTVKITINGSSDSKVYNGSAQTSDTTVTPSCDDSLFDAAKFKYTGETTITETNVGEYNKAIDTTKASYNDANINAVFVAGTDVEFSITPASIDDDERFTISDPEDTKYNGEEQKQPVTVKDGDKTLVEGTDYELVYSDDVTNAGAVIVTVKGKGNYEGSVKKSYTITPRDITLESGSAQKVYDGTPLTKHSVKIGGDGMVKDDSKYLEFDFTGSQTYVGSSPNYFTYEWTDGDSGSSLGAVETVKSFFVVYAAESAMANNYEITDTEYGTLTVTDKGVDPDDVVTKTHSGKKFKVGDTITFTIQATNIYDDARTITLEEQEGVTLEQSVFEDVEPGQTVETTATYKVTEKDAKSGKFRNVVKAKFDGDGEFSNTDTVTDIRGADGKKKHGSGPNTGDNGFGFDLTMFFGSAAAFLAMLAGRRRREQE